MPASKLPQLKHKTLKRRKKKKIRKKDIIGKFEEKHIKGHNKDFQDNHERIGEAFYEILKEKKRKPKNRELAEATGLSETTIENHIKELSLETIKRPWRGATDKVLAGMTVSAIKRGGLDGLSWFKLVWGWKEKQTLEVKNVIVDITEDVLNIIREFVLPDRIEELTKRVDSVFDKYNKDN